MREIEAQELGERLSRIRLPVKEIARRVKCDQSTISNHARGLRQMSDRLKRDVVAALVEEELSLLDHLVALHGRRGLVAGHPDQAVPASPRAA